MRHHSHGRRAARPGGWQQAEQPDAADATEWFAGRLPDDWFAGEPEVTVDREEITVVGRLADSDHPESEARASGRAARFREHTRSERMQIADEAEARYGRKVSWGVDVAVDADVAVDVAGEADVDGADSTAPDGGRTERILFTHLAVPVMTRLRQPERRVLDTLVDAGVARSRSDALGWCVRLVGDHADEWLDRLREAMREVDDLRSAGPRL